MLLIAAIAHNSASIPLLIIGSGWLAIGLFGFRQRRRMATEVQLAGGVLSFTFPNQTQSMPVAEVVEIRPSRGDINRFAPILVKNVNGDVVRLTPRLGGLIELLVEVRRLNPDVRLGDF